MTRNTFIIVYLTAIMILVISGVAAKLSVFHKADSVIALISAVLFFEYFIIELFFIILISLWLINSQSKLLRIAGYSITSAFIIINITQLIAMKRGGEFLSRLALDNLNHISIVATKTNLFSLAALLFVCVLFPIIIEKFIKKASPLKPLLILSTVFVMGVILLLQSEHLLPKRLIDFKDDHFYNNLLKNTSPSLSLYKVLFAENKSVALNDLTLEETRTLKKYGFFYNSQSTYPLIKDYIYQGELKFESLIEAPKRPNVIVFFIEGYAARTMGVYGSKIKNITPNIDAFSKQTMVVDNYYNHTAATYRGLHGSLCSLFPFYGGNTGLDANYRDMAKRSYFCLTDVFKNNHYETIFFDAHRKDNAYVDELAADLGFDKVLTAEELSVDFLQQQEPHREFALSDQQFFKSFVNFLKDREASYKPFFASLYNLETHAFIDIEKPYGKQYGDGSNNALNTIHNLDHAFGQFWHYFKNSSYAENTIIVFTTDHTHYTENTYTSEIKDHDYQNLFIDKIPLLIYDPTHKLPERYNANYATSIDFAPSLIQLSGFKNSKNPFLGSSIFSREQTKDVNFGIASFSDQYYLINSEKIHRLGLSKSYQQELALIAKFIQISQHREVNNNLWHNDKQ